MPVTGERNRARDVQRGVGGRRREQRSELAQRLAGAAAARENQRPFAGVGLILAESVPYASSAASAAAVLPRQDSTRASSSHGSAVVA